MDNKINLKKATDYLVLSASAFTSIFFWMFHYMMTIDLEWTRKTSYLYYGGVVIFLVFNFIATIALFYIRDRFLRKVIAADNKNIKLWCLVVYILTAYIFLGIIIFLINLKNFGFSLNMSLVLFTANSVIITVFNPYFQRKTYLKKQYIYLKTS